MRYAEISRNKISIKLNKKVLPLVLKLLLFAAVANRFVAEYGVVRLSIGEAIRKVLNFQSYTELARQINLHLRAGTTVPDELAVQALEVALLDMQCQTRG